MVHILRRRSTHADRLEGFLGKAAVDHLSLAARYWHGPPLAVAGVPGEVYVRGGGDFVGHVGASGFSGILDLAEDAVRRAARRQRLSMGQGFSSFSDMISEQTQGRKGRHFSFVKGPGATLGSAMRAATFFYAAGHPAAGALPAGAPGGTQYTDATQGGMPFTNPTGGDTQHIITAFTGSSVASQTLILYDRLWACAKTMNSNAAEATTGLPLRYQSTVATDAEYAGGNFVTIEAQTGLPATGHNHLTYQYTDQDGNAGASIPSVAGISSCPTNGIDIANLGEWHLRLASGDSGVLAVTQMQHSAALASGALACVVGHVLAMFPHPIASALLQYDGINSAFNLERVLDDACLAFIALQANTTSTSFSGRISTLAG